MCIISVPSQINDYILLAELESSVMLSLVIITNVYFSPSKRTEFSELLKIHKINLSSKTSNSIKIFCSYSSLISLFGIQLFWLEKNDNKYYSNKEQYQITNFNYINNILGLDNIPLSDDTESIDRDLNYTKYHSRTLQCYQYSNQ
jgi:hypothetical protein